MKDRQNKVKHADDLTNSEWRLVTRSEEVKKTSLRRIDLIVVHCSATQRRHHYPPTALIADHKQRGFITAGYHFYITQEGNLYALRPVDWSGAHARGYNQRSIGVCYEGGLDSRGLPADTRTPEQRQMLSQLITLLQIQYPNAVVVGHRDLSPDRNGDGQVSSEEWTKACPCFEAKLYNRVSPYSSLKGVNNGTITIH